MIALRAMTEEEFRVFLAQSVPEYAAEKVKAGNWTPEEALDRSRDDHAKLLPEGLTSPNQYLYTIELEGSPVGRLWLSVDPQTAGGGGFIYDLLVAEPFRRQGIAAEAMHLLERDALRLGVLDSLCMCSDTTWPLEHSMRSWGTKPPTSARPRPSPPSLSDEFRCLTTR